MSKNLDPVDKMYKSTVRTYSTPVLQRDWPELPQHIAIERDIFFFSLFHSRILMKLIVKVNSKVNFIWAQVKIKFDNGHPTQKRRCNCCQFAEEMKWKISFPTQISFDSSVI